MVLPSARVKASFRASFNRSTTAALPVKIVLIVAVSQTLPSRAVESACGLLLRRRAQSSPHTLAAEEPAAVATRERPAYDQTPPSLRSLRCEVHHAPDSVVAALPAYDQTPPSSASVLKVGFSPINVKFRPDLRADCHQKTNTAKWALDACVQELTSILDSPCSIADIPIDLSSVQDLS